MATVVYGTTNDFNAGIYSEPHPNTVRFLQNQMENYAQASSTFVGAATSLNPYFHSYSTQNSFEMHNLSDR